MRGRAVGVRIGTPGGAGGSRWRGSGRRGWRVATAGRLVLPVTGLPLILAGGVVDLAYHAGLALPLAAAEFGHLAVLAGMVLTLAGALTAAARRPGVRRGGHEEES